MNRIALLISVLLVSASALAEVAPPMTYPQGRLFTTAQQRQNLDRIRQQDVVESEPLLVNILPQLNDQAAEVLPAEITYSGYVMGPPRIPTVWIDGDSELTEKSARGFKFYVGTTNGREARFKTSEGSSMLKPGQAWLPREDRVIEQFEARFLQPAAGSESMSAADAEEASAPAQETQP